MLLTDIQEMSGLNVDQIVGGFYLNICGFPHSIWASTRMVLQLAYKVFQILSN
jgi:hypothetical protein